jgi:hypothetical protein
MSNYVLVFRGLPRTAQATPEEDAAWGVPEEHSGGLAGQHSPQAGGAGLRGAGARGFQRRATATGTWLRELDTSTPQGARPGNREFPAAQSIELM